LELHIKKRNISLFVRIPEWLNIEQTKIIKNGMPVDFSQERVKNINYINLGKLNERDYIIIEFPVDEKISAEIIAKKEYKMTWKGSRVTMIDPAGSHMSLYQ